MKKIFAFLMVFFVVFSLSTTTLASNEVLPDEITSSEQEKTEDNSKDSFVDSIDGKKIDNTIQDAGDTAMSFGQKVLDQITKWCLPFCAIAVIWGAVQYFILGIRNLYKKRQGLLLMWGSMTFYVVALFINLVLTFMVGK